MRNLLGRIDELVSLVGEADPDHLTRASLAVIDRARSILDRNEADYVEAVAWRLVGELEHTRGLVAE